MFYPPAYKKNQPQLRKRDTFQIIALVHSYQTYNAASIFSTPPNR